MKILFSIMISAILIFIPWQVSAESVPVDVSDLVEVLPEETVSVLEGAGITPDNSGAEDLSVKSVISYCFEQLKSHATKPIQLFITLFAITILCTLSHSITEQSSLQGVFLTLGGLCGATLASSAVSDVLNEVLKAVSIGSDFTIVFIPMFTGVSAVLGHIGSATAVNSAVVAVAQLFSQLTSKILAPLCSVILGVSVAGVADEELNLGKIACAIQKIASWGLALIMTVFTSVLSLQTVVASAADNSAIKAAKFVVSQGVPFVGSTVSDTINMFSGGLSMLKGSVGTYGIIALAVMVIPSLTLIVCYNIALMLAEYSAEMFGQKPLAQLYKNVGIVMKLLSAFVVCFLVLNVSSVLIMMSATKAV